MSPEYVPYGYTPDSTFMRVDLPAPFSPQIAWISPARTSRSTSERAFTPGNVLVMLRISRMLVAICPSPLMTRPGGSGPRHEGGGQRPCAFADYSATPEATCSAVQ